MSSLQSNETSDLVSCNLVDEALSLLLTTQDLAEACRASALEDWRSQSVAHADAMRVAEAEWALFAALPDEPLDLLGKARLAAEATLASVRDYPVQVTGAMCLVAVFFLAPVIVLRTAAPQTEPLRSAEGPPNYQHALHHEAEATRIKTGRGEQREVELPNGTRLWLNWNSEVLIADLDDEIHIDVLIGDAFFSILENSRRPIVVHAGEAIVRAPTTEFAVHTHGPEDAVFQVREGVVTISSAADEGTRQIGPAQQSHYLQGTGSEVRKASLRSIAAWREGKLIFDERPLHEVLCELSHYTQRNIRIGTIINKGETVSAIYSLQEADAALMQIADAYGLELVNPSTGEYVIRSVEARRL